MISVIVPVYQVEKYLRRCVDSILEQTYQDLEIILVDDGSFDSSPQICDEYAAIDSRVRVIHKKNGGVSSARNTGLDVATGEYIAFVDSDDYINNKLYELCLEIINVFNPDLIDYGINHFNEHDEIIRSSIHGLPKNKLINRKTIVDEIVPQMVHVKCQDDRYLGVYIWNKIFKNSIIQQYNIRFDEKLKMWEDGIFNIEYLKYCSSIYCIDEKYYYYRDIPNSLSTQYNVNLHKYAISIYERYRELYSSLYNFDNQYSKLYRFELAHGIIMRTLSFYYLKSDCITLLKQMNYIFSNKMFVQYLCSNSHHNPFIFVAQFALKKNITVIAILSYCLYFILKQIQ